MSNAKNIHVVVENLGPVRRAELEIPINGVTAIIGPNASGKTYLAQSVFMALELLSFAMVEAFMKNMDRVVFDLENVDTYMGSGFEAENAYVELDRGDSSIKMRFEKRVVHVETFVCKELIESTAKIVVSHLENLISKTIEDVPSEMMRKIAKALVPEMRNILPFLPTLIFSEVAYIPAERIVLLAFLWPTITETLSIYLLRIVRGHPITHPKPLLIRYLVTLLDIVREKSFVERSEEIARIVGARVLFDEKSYSINFDVGIRTLMPHLVSTGMLQLAGLAPFLVSDRFQYLIIEEPEINVHPNKQLEVAEALWNAVGKTILVTTHSDYLVMWLAKNSRKKPVREFRAYLLHNGVTKELHVDEKGNIEEIETVAEAIDRLLET